MAVNIFLGFDLNLVESADKSIDSRVQRIQLSSRILGNRFGPLTVEDSRPAKMLLVDAAWIERTHNAGEEMCANSRKR